VIFGIILGAAIISEIIDELTGSGNQAD
jgi:hypothetical protein